MDGTASTPLGADRRAIYDRFLPYCRSNRSLTLAVAEERKLDDGETGHYQREQHPLHRQ